MHKPHPYKVHPRKHFSIMGLFSSPPPKTKSELLYNVDLISVTAPSLDAPLTGASIKSQQLWAERPALIVLIRRPGCLLCRAEAHTLATHRQLIENEYGVRMYAVVNQEFGAMEFAINYWKGEAYFDKELGMFKAIGDGEVRRGSLMQMLLPSVLSRMSKAKKSGLDFNTKGDGTILGGLVLMAPGDGGVVYEYAEREFGDHAPLEVVLEKCKELGEAYPRA
ncbi:hypothetical protein BCR44DRAFT_132011 [Catenaria anguillulae PL171]|uniref:Peroxiredoxin-like 2A n=1 Tax=Catenaria anguillulae PL171 TaxID=765915 RepID=A0A1Y2HJP4_9FUNG|nr:hypothetical protein BCR44DRAFT_132011 [Catenaria anguillulae PL171]